VSATARAWSALRGKLLAAAAFAGLAFLFAPIVVVVAFSFNDPEGRYNLSWSGFTLDHWLDPFAAPGLGEALGNSVLIAAVAGPIAVALGALLAIGLTRHRFRGRGAGELFVFLPLATPEVILGASLLGLFLTVNLATGLLTIILGHVTFCLSYAVVTIRARLEGMDAHLEEAARDLGAGEWAALRLVTLPLLAPALASALLLALALSFDDFVTTNFNSGQTVTLPMYIWGAARQGVPPEVNVIASAALVVALLAFAIRLVAGVEKLPRANREV
jgi:spermidine/putrescine transport system permease protein